MKKSAEGKHLNKKGTNYDKGKYPCANNTVDIGICTIIDGTLKILLGKRADPPYQYYWVLPGGYCTIGKESLEQAANRELEEETNVKGMSIRQLGTYSNPKRDPRNVTITTAFYTLTSNKILEQEIKGKDDILETKWYNIRKVPKKMGFDHNIIVKDLIKKLKEDIMNKPIAFELVGKTFTWTELQEVCEAVLGKELISPNFRRKFNTMYIIEETKQKSEIVKGRPPTLLKFKGVRDKF